MKKLLLFGSMVLLFFGCHRTEPFSEVPYIEFVRLDKVDEGTGVDNQANLVVRFQDGDGDIGLNDADTTGLFSKDSIYYYNFFIILCEKQHGEWVELELPTPLHARVPHLSNDVPESIEGTLSIDTYINNPTSPYDTVRLTCWLVDRALHHSDTITTPEIIVKK